MLNCFLNFFRIHQPVHMILVSSVHHVPSQNIFCKDLNILRAIINLNTCRNSKLKLSLLINTHVKRKLKRQTEEMVYCLVQGSIYKLGLLKSQTLTEGTIDLVSFQTKSLLTPSGLNVRANVAGGLKKP